ncbi:hypothetical protein ACF0H5_024132 [Mactra antiquata]
MATLSVVKTLAKIGIAGGAVAVTSNHGVWSTNTENGMKSLNKAKTVFYSAADKEIIEKIPEPKSFGNKVVSSWNSGVTSAFSFIQSSPDKVTEYAQSNISKLWKDK